MRILVAKSRYPSYSSRLGLLLGTMSCRTSRSSILLSLLILASNIQQGIAAAGREKRLGSSLTEEKEALNVEEETSFLWGRLLQEEMSMPPPEQAGGTLLAIGDSLCAGHLPEPKNTIFFSDEAYTNTLFDYVQDKYDFDTLEKVCCSGEDSHELIDASYAIPPSDGSNCYDGPSQIDAAIQALETGEVRLISISLGANDVFGCVFAPDIEACVTTRIQEFVVNLLTILTTLSEVTENNLPPIVAMTPYNPLLAYSLSEDANEQALAPLSQQVILGLQTEAAKVYDNFNIPNVFGLFVFDGLNETLVDGTDTPQNVASICRWTGMCDETDSGDFVLKSAELRDIHATPEGYDKLGEAHFSPVDELL